MSNQYAWTEERLARLCLNWFPLFGSRTLRKLATGFVSWKDAWRGNVSQFERLGLSHGTIERFLEWRKTIDPEGMIERLWREGISVLFLDDPDFPLALTHSSDPPDILFFRGKLPKDPCVSVVGTRRMTTYGSRCVEAIVPELSEMGFTIVSGMALGIDAAAHTSALDAHGNTIAILGTGVDDGSLYPATHTTLAHRILESGGAIVSEFPPETGSRKEHFPMRNRLIASWSLTTIVIERALKSGSLITAKCALEENRVVMAVPGPIWSESSMGPNSLLRHGAIPCTSAKDVLDALQLDLPELASKARTELPHDPLDRSILQLLHNPVHIDDIARQLHRSSNDISSRMTVLELISHAKQIGGQMWVRC